MRKNFPVATRLPESFLSDGKCLALTPARRVRKRNANACGSGHYRFFFLWRFLRRRFLRLCVAILCRLRFFPQGILLRML